MKKNFRLFNKPYELIFVAAALALFIVLVVVPLLGISKYDHACADDYSYGLNSHLTWSNSHSLAWTVKAAFDTTKENWYAWQGTFVSIFLMALSPAVFGEQYYSVTPYIMLAALSVSLIFLVKILVYDFLKGTYCQTVLISLAALTVCIENIYDPASAFFWYNSAIHYTVMQSVMFIMGGSALFVAMKRRIVLNSVICCLCAFCLGGGNYINALVGMLFYVGIIAFGFVYRGKKSQNKVKDYIFQILPILFYLTSFVISFIAPGNEVRGAYYTKTSPFNAIFLSFTEGITNAFEWTTWFQIGFMIIIFPTLFFLGKKIEKNKKIAILGLASIIYFFCIYAASFTPSIYSMGSAELPRTLGNSKMLYTLFLFYVEFWISYLVGFIPEHEKVSRKVIPYFILVGVLTVVCSFVLHPYKEGRFPSYASYKYVKEGYAQIYYAQYLERLDILKDTNVKDAVLDENVCKLNVLYIDDIVDNPSDWRNQSVAKWYGKSSVVLDTKG